MAALTGDLQAPFKYKGPIRCVRMAAGVKIYAGALVAINATGYAVPAADTAGFLGVIGRSEEQVDNTAGGNGDKLILVASGIFRYQTGGGGNALTQADVGKLAYVLDDQTVTRAAGAPTGTVVAGRVWAPGDIYKEPAGSFYISISDNAQ